MNNAAVFDTSNLTAKRDFTALKAEVDQLYIEKLVIVTTGWNNLKTKLVDLDVDKLDPVLSD